MAARSKTRVCGRSLAGIAGSNPCESMDVCWEGFVLSGRGLCDGLITRPEVFYRLWCVCLNVIVRRWPTGGCWAMEEGGGMKRKTVHF